MVPELSVGLGTELVQWKQSILNVQDEMAYDGAVDWKLIPTARRAYGGLFSTSFPASIRHVICNSCSTIGFTNSQD